MSLITHPRSKEYNAIMNRKRTPTYNSWRNMKSRVLNPNATQFEYWGGKGLVICERWMDFKNFLADMGKRPEGTTLDRIDNSKGYYPENCRWATHVEQQNNRTNNKGVK